MILEINTETKQISVIKFKEMETFDVQVIGKLLIKLGENLNEPLPVKISEADMNFLKKGSIK